MTATLDDPRVPSAPHGTDQPAANWMSRLNALLEPRQESDDCADRPAADELRELLSELRDYPPDVLIRRLDSGILSSWASAAGRGDLATSLREIETDTDDDPARRLRSVLGLLLRELRQPYHRDIGA